MSTLRMLMAGIFFLLSILIFATVEAEAGPYEIIIINNAGVTRGFKIEKIDGRAYWNEDFNIDTSDRLEGGTITIADGNQKGWWVDSYQSAGQNTEGVGAGIYLLFNTQNPSHHFYLNMMTDDLFNKAGIFDIYFDYDGNGFSCDDGLNCFENNIVNGDTLNIWDETIANHSLGEFELSDPSGLDVSPSGGSPSHPVLTWTSSDPPYVNSTVGGSKHDIWRRQSTGGSYTKIEDNYISLSYTDTDIYTGGGPTFYYKVRGRDNADTKYSAGYSNVDNISGAFGAKIATGGGSNPRQSEFRVSNYPNPFNPETSITFELPAASEIELVVYNILGKEVAKLASGHYAAGKHTVRWDGSKNASGLYYYTLKTGDEVAIGKMLLTK